jgi:hypothetical protein
MVFVLASSAADPKYYQIGIYCFSAKYAALRNKSNVWLTRNQDDVSE